MSKKTTEDIQRVVLVCTGSSCAKKGNKELARKARAFLKKEDLKKGTRIITTRCTGYCSRAPVFCVQPDNAWYQELSGKEGWSCLKKHLKSPYVDN